MTQPEGFVTLFHGRLLPVGEAIFAAVIWSSSFIAVKIVLRYTGPFSAAGLRYFLAFVFLLPWLWQRRRSSLSLTHRQWSRFVVMGFFQYAIGNGTLFFALKTISATTGSLALCLVPIPVLLLGMIRLKEWPRPLQLVAFITTLGGSVLFFSPGGVELRDPLALGLLGVTILSFSVFPVLGREIARDRQVDNITLTAIPLGIGGGLLLLAAVLLEGIPRLPFLAWMVVLGLALVNTILAYLLYNHALQYLPAVEVDVMLNLTPIGTAIIAWGALGEHLASIQIVAMFLVVIGASLMQWRKDPLR